MTHDVSGVYYILCLRNDRIYIGQSERVNERFRQHKMALLGNRHDIADLQADWSTYGEQSFEFGVLTTVPRWPHNRIYMQINNVERMFIRIYQADSPKYGYNTNQSEKSRKSQACIRRLQDEANEAAHKYRPS